MFEKGPIEFIGPGRVRVTGQYLTEVRAMLTEVRVTDEGRVRCLASSEKAASVLFEVPESELVLDRVPSLDVYEVSWVPGGVVLP